MDGFTSAAVLVNYIDAQRQGEWHDFKGEITPIFHKTKMHGLGDEDVMTRLFSEISADLLIIPDASGSQDQYDALTDHMDIIVLDHHDTAERGDNANVIVVNNQHSADYTNKNFSGVGIVWQFCRVLDNEMETNLANRWLDLVALGNAADVMDLRSAETRFIVGEGLKEDTLQSYFMQYCKFTMHNMQGKDYNYHTVGFYIAPLFNSVCRIGDMVTKEFMFNALLDSKARLKVPDGTKNHTGEVDLVQEALRLMTNTKSRQDRRKNKLVELIDNVIQEENLLEHKVLILAFDDFEEEWRQMSGLVANVIADLYQRPCIITFRTGKGTYVGSLRTGGTNPAYTNFKDQCAASGCCSFVAGHQDAAGIGLKGGMIQDMIDYFDEKYADVDSAIYYDVDFIISANDPSLPDLIAELAPKKNAWGKGLEEPKIAVKDVKIGPGTLSLFGKQQTTLCIKNEYIKFLNFKSGKTEFDSLCPPQDPGITTYYDATILGVDPEMNVFRDTVTPQLKIEDYEVHGVTYDF